MHAEERHERVGETADRVDADRRDTAGRMDGTHERVGDTANGAIQPERMTEPERVTQPERMTQPERVTQPERLGAQAEPPTGDFPTGDGDRERAVELMGREDVAKYRAGWQEVQTRFVDDPRAAVRDADRLVGDVTRSLTATLSERKQELEDAWQQGSTVETEELRQAMRRYRSFFDRLLNV